MSNNVKVWRNSLAKLERTEGLFNIFDRLHFFILLSVITSTVNI